MAFKSILDAVQDITENRHFSKLQGMPKKVKNLEVISRKQQFTALNGVVEPNEEIQLDFAGPLPDENNKEVYILVGVDRFSRFPSTKLVTNNKADTLTRFTQTLIANHGDLKKHSL